MTYLRSALFLSLFAFNSAFAVELKDIVVGFDYQAETNEERVMFPCHTYTNVMFCDGKVNIADAKCRQTVAFKDMGTNLVVTCKLINGENVVLAVSKGKIMDDRTQAAGFFRLSFNPRVRLETLGKSRSALIVE